MIAGLFVLSCLLGWLSGPSVQHGEPDYGTTLVRKPRRAYQVFPVDRMLSSAIHCAAFSAIMRVGALVFPLVITGITPASTMRKPSTP